MTIRNVARLAAVAALGAYLAATPVHAEFSTGKKAPEFALKTPDSKTLRLADLRDKVVLLNFWGPS